MRILFSLIIILSSLHAYGQDNSIYHKQIQEALNKQILCIGPIDWPVSIENGSDLWIKTQMHSFVDAGLAISRKEKGKIIWDLSKNGAHEFINDNGFCYGKMKVKSIKTVQLNHDGLTIVTFTYLIDGLPHWAKNPSIRFSNTDLDNRIFGIDNIYYQAIFKKDTHGYIRLTGELEQLELYY